MMQGVDYSFSRPDINCLWQSGHRFVARYTSNGTSSKNATKPEIDALVAKGFKVVIVHETNAGDPLLGRERGLHDAAIAKDKCKAIGMPDDRPIYFALDVDPNPLSNDQIAACKAYLDGCAQILGRSRVGIYGGFRAIDVLVPGWAHFGWQTYAWSGGRISNKAHFRQYRNGVRQCGGDVDLNETYKPDFGQWPLTVQEDDDMNTAEFRAELSKALADNDPIAERLQARVREAIEAELTEWGGEFRTAVRTIVKEELAKASQ